MDLGGGALVPVPWKAPSDLPWPKVPPADGIGDPDPYAHVPSMYVEASPVPPPAVAAAGGVPEAWKEEQCAICLNAIDGEASDMVPKGAGGRPVDSPGAFGLHALQCGHGFHPACIKAWLERHNSCPLCKADVRFHAPAQHMNNFDADALRSALKDTYEKEVIIVWFRQGVCTYDRIHEVHVFSRPRLPRAAGFCA